ncbi:MAG: hypothetical protein D6796_03460, partial [Caldilineae bacterium]
YGRIVALVNELKEGHFLRDKPVKVFSQVARQLEARDWRTPWRRLAAAFVERRFPVGGLDASITALYRWGGRLFFFPPVQLLLGLVALAGLYPFARLLQEPARFPLFGVRGGGYLAGLALLLLANTLVIFLHELAHALTTKHYGREVPSGGAMIFYGMPAFYVNTMDIWLEPRRHRIAVSWAGPFSGMVLGGLCSFLALAIDQPLLSQLCFKMAFLGYVGCLVNLNPLLELDGYFMLMDALGIPMLRRRALHFLKTELPGKLRSLAVNAGAGATADEPLFHREDLIFTVYGLLSAAYTVYVVWFTLYLWNRRFVRLLADLWANSGWGGRVVVALAGAAIFVPAMLAIGTTAWRGATRAFGWLERRDFFERESNIAVLAMGGLVVLLGVPALLPESETARALWTVGVAGMAVWGLAATARQYTGSEVQAQFWGLVASAGMLALAAAALALQREKGARTLAQLATLPLPLSGLGGLGGMDLRRLHRAERGALLLLPLAGFGAAVVAARRAPTELESFLSGGSLFALSLFLAMAIPTLVTYVRTHFLLPWSLLLPGVLLTGGYPFLAPSLTRDDRTWFFLLAMAFWAVGGIAFAAAGWRIRFPAPSWETGFSLSEEERLRHAFTRFLEALFEGFRRAFGDRRAQSVDDDLDVIAVTAGWDVELDRGRVRDRLDLKRMTILEQADRYREVLARAIDLMDNWAGSRFIARAAQAAYDGLPWPERETLGRYVLSGTPWGASIARQFATARGEQFRLLRALPLFAAASAETLDRVLAVARRETVPAGVVLAREGKPYPSFALVMGGTVEVWKRGPDGGRSVLAGELQRGGALGSVIFAPDGGGAAQATYRTATPTDLLVVTRAAARQLAAQGVNLHETAVHLSEMGRMLAEMPLFAELAPQQIETLLHKMGRLRLPKGATIVRQGQPRRYFYIIEAGQVGVLASAEGGEQKIVATLGRGEHFGETSLYTDRPYSATCIALTDVRLLTLDEFTFDRLIATSHQMSHYVEQVSSGRLKDTRRKLRAGATRSP